MWRPWRAGSPYHPVPVSASSNSQKFLYNFIFGLLASSSIYISTWYRIDRFRDQLKSNTDYEDHFDFIIVGAGSAGSVVASRLSENSNHKVLLLEAGGEPHPLQSIPAFSLFLLNYPELDWMHKTVPLTKACLASDNRQSGWSAGKGLGGTSNINFLIYSRGNPKDFDNWANLTGDPEWEYKNMLKYFKKIENYDPDDPWYTEEMHGSDGPLKVQVPPYTGMGKYFLKAAQEKGFPITDLNGYYTEGFDYIHYPIKDGMRQGTYATYIKQARNRPNLYIYKYSHVNRVLFKDEKTAYGVEYDRHGLRKKAYAKKEVIISAGAINSPKLLMLSGIGPRDHLESFGIPVIKDLPVGKNLQDHISTNLGPFFITPQISDLMERDLTPSEIYNYNTKGQGKFTSSGCHAMGFIVTSMAKKSGETDWPDLQMIFISAATFKDYAANLARSFNVDYDKANKYYAHAVGKDSFTIGVSVGRPKQRGEIRLSSINPYEELIIDPKYLENDYDLQVFIEGAKTAIDLIENTTVFQEIGGRFTDQPFPGCEDIEFRSDKYWECYLRQFSVTLHHPAGSCSMGSKKSPTTVVDSHLKVIGVKNLRVIDASIMPALVVGNTNTPTIVIGEKGADLINSEWSSTSDNDNDDKENELFQRTAKEGSSNKIFSRSLKTFFENNPVMNTFNSVLNWVRTPGKYIFF